MRRVLIGVAPVRSANSRTARHRSLGVRREWLLSSSARLGESVEPAAVLADHIGELVKRVLGLHGTYLDEYGCLIERAIGLK